LVELGLLCMVVAYSVELKFEAALLAKVRPDLNEYIQIVKVQLSTLNFDIHLLSMQMSVGLL
jgi:hypothetical protein